MRGCLSVMMQGGAALAALAAGAAHAQDSGRNVAVMERQHKGYEPLGVRAGAFMVHPQVRVDAEANDNIFATDEDPVGDLIMRVTPSVSISSGWSRHAVGASATATQTSYMDHGEQDALDYALRLFGRLDVHSDAAVDGSVRQERVTESRIRSIIAADAAEPVQFDRNVLAAGARYDFGRITLRGDAQRERREYDTVLTRGGALVSDDRRDVEIIRFGGRADYAFTPDTSLFLRLEHNRREHDEDGSRDSDGQSVLAGADFDLTNLIRGQIGLGYLRQAFDDGTETTGFATEASVLWFPTQLTTVTLAASRQFEESTSLDAAGSVDTSVDLTVDHELRRWLVLSAAGGYWSSNYSGLDRLDHGYSASLRARYLLNRIASLNVRAEHFSRSSSGADQGDGVDVNAVTIGLTLRR